MTKKLEVMLERGATDDEFDGMLNEHASRLTDHGHERTRLVQKHVAQLRRLLQPTQDSKMALWTMSQGDDFYRKPATLTLALFFCRAHEPAFGAPVRVGLASYCPP